MRSYCINSLLILFIFPLVANAQGVEPTGNHLFEFLDKPATSEAVKKFDEFYNIQAKDNATHLQASKGIEYRLKNEKIKTIITGRLFLRLHIYILYSGNNRYIK